MAAAQNAAATAATAPAAAACANSTAQCSSFAFAAEHGLDKQQVERYSRHLLLPSFGVAGQGRLCAARVLIVGCGGLGSPAALYLAAAGVGTLGLVDHDVVELSNMHRQVIHTEARLGEHKARSAAAAAAAVNSSIAVVPHLDGLHPGNAVAIVSQYDLVIDASDNPPTRYLLSDAAVACGLPLVSAAAVGTEGQLTVYNAGPGAPCYRCLFPECPPPANCARCADAGVLGPVPGVMGVLQALEAVKLLGGAGDVLAGRLLLFDDLAGRFTTIKLRGRAAGCVACGEAAAITRDSIAAYDYAAFTGGQRPNDAPPAPLQVLPPQQRLTAGELQALLPTQQRQGSVPAAGPASQAAGSDGPSSSTHHHQQQQQQGPSRDVVLLDVRPPEQFAIMALPGAVNVPFTKLEQQLPEVLRLCRAQEQQEQPDGAQAAQCDDGNATTGEPAAVSGSGDGDGAAAASGASAPRVVVMCRRGNHSQLAVQRLRDLGVPAVDVVGGYEAWAAHVDDSMPVL